MSWKEAGEELSPTPVSALMVAQGLGILVGSWGQLWTPTSPRRVIATDPEARAEEGGWPGGGPGCSLACP